MRFRLRSGFPLALAPSEGRARVIARAMQSDAMILSDRGSISLTAQGDLFTVPSHGDVSPTQCAGHGNGDPDDHPGMVVLPQKVERDRVARPMRAAAWFAARHVFRALLHDASES